MELEATNVKGETITVRRHVAGEKDPRLVEVVFGSAITDRQTSKYRVQPFFVGVEGAAQRERGFHHFFAEFFDLDLPYVKRFKGEDVPLYVECIAPLMFIEQIRGWGGIQATLPQSFGIRNVAKLAVEYVLGLDVIENEKRRLQVTEEATIIREEWKNIRDTLVQMASKAAGRLMNVPPSPTVSLTDEPWICVGSESQTPQSLGDLLVVKRGFCVEHETEESYRKPVDVELKEKLDAKEIELLVAQSELSQLRIELRAEEDELKKLRARLDFVRNDIQRNRDIKRLRDFGVEAGLSIIEDRCPTCNQTINGSLIPTQSTIMSVEDNINFLRTEAEAIGLLITAGEERLSRLRSQKAAKSKAVDDVRTSIRDIRSDLLEKRDFSMSAIREQVHLQEEITRLETLRDEFDEQIERLKGVSAQWQENRANYSELPDDYFSKADRVKLATLSERFSSNVEKFGYRSTGMGRLRISEDNYRPVCDEFEVAFGASASDNIRLIWAYTLALLQVSLSKTGSHWGIILFDEPEQQQMKEASSDALYEEISRMHPNECQVIIATSAPVGVTQRRLAKLNHNRLEFGDKVIRPL